jgi:AraC family transcriptional regulator of adaptative response/methylated-DNA-[protein]-cysteine methyltransferase
MGMSIAAIDSPETTHVADPSAMERAFYASDAAWDGQFVAAVRTTGIFCRPSCRGRKPLRKNVTFVPDAAAARAAGYRPCLRCQPDTASTVRIREIETPVGPLTLGATERALVLADFSTRRMMPSQLATVRRRIGPTVAGDAPLLDRAEQQLGEYFAGVRQNFDLPLDHPGSAFQERVWTELRRIPYGETIAYRDLAERVGSAQAPRAVGRANGSNRLAIIIPCHRVVAAGGGLGGYGGGLTAKRYLLDLEAAVSSGAAPGRWVRP